MTWYDTIWYDMIEYDMIEYDTIDSEFQLSQQHHWYSKRLLFLNPRHLIFLALCQALWGTQEFTAAHLYVDHVGLRDTSWKSRVLWILSIWPTFIYFACCAIYILGRNWQCVAHEFRDTCCNWRTRSLTGVSNQQVGNQTLHLSEIEVF